MRASSSLSALLLCCLAAAAVSGQQQQPRLAPLQQQSSLLPAFERVSSCLPINILVQPNTTAGGAGVYNISIHAEPSVLPALNYTVSGGTLLLQSTANFSTGRPIQVTVTLPADALKAVSHQGPGAEVYVAPGFTASSFNASSAFGAGQLYLNGLSAGSVTLESSGTGDVVLVGSFGSVNASFSGTGGLYIAGVNGSVGLDLRGVSSAYVQPSQPGVAITGTAQGINAVHYTDGSCSISSAFPLLQNCQSALFVPIPVPDPVWSCGLVVAGPFACSDQGTAYTATSGGFSAASGALNTTPVTTTTAGVAAFTPSSFEFQGASPAGPGTGTQQQAGAVMPNATSATSQVIGTGSVSSTAVAGPGGASTSTTQGNQSTAFQTTGQQTGGTTANSASTAFSSATPSASSSASAVSSSSGGAAGGPVTAGVIRVAGPGNSTATATTQACQALPSELRIPVNGTENGGH